MDWNTIIEVGLKIISIGGYILLAILACKRKKSPKPTVVDNHEEGDKINNLITVITNSIKMAENMGEQINGKSGFFKFDYVLNRAKEFCLDNGLNVDSNFLKEKIETLVDLLNFNKSTQVENITDTEKNIIKGVKE